MKQVNVTFYEWEPPGQEKMLVQEFHPKKTPSSNTLPELDTVAIVPLPICQRAAEALVEHFPQKRIFLLYNDPETATVAIHPTLNELERFSLTTILSCRVKEITNDEPPSLLSHQTHQRA